MPARACARTSFTSGWASAHVVNATTAGSIASSVGIAAGNTVEALIAAALARRFASGARAFHGPRTVFLFTGAMVPAAVASATVGVSSLTLAGYTARTDLAGMWATWILGDLSGAWNEVPESSYGIVQPGQDVLKPFAPTAPT